MSKVNTVADLGKITEPAEFMRQTSPLVKGILDVVNGNLEFDVNLKTQTLSVTFSTADTNQQVKHNLNKTGVRYIVVKKSASCDIYDGTGLVTANVIYLRSTAPASVTLILF